MNVPQLLRAGSAFEAAVVIVGLTSALAIGHLIAAPLSGVRIVSGGWGAFVLVQAVVQIGVSWIARWAEGGAENNVRASALAAFGLSIGAFGMLADLPVRWFTDGSVALAEEASSTLFGRIICAANAAECGVHYGVWSLVACVVVLVLLGAAAYKLRTTKSSDPINVLHWTLLSLSVGSYALSSLLLQDWVGELEKVSAPRSESIDPQLLQGLLAGFVVILCLSQIGLATSAMFRKEARRIGVPRFWSVLSWLRQLLIATFALTLLAVLVLVVFVCVWFAGWNLFLSLNSVWTYLGYLARFGWPELADADGGSGFGVNAPESISTLDVTPISLLVGAVGATYFVIRNRRFVGNAIVSALKFARAGFPKLVRGVHSGVAKHSTAIALAITGLAIFLPWPDRSPRIGTPWPGVAIPIPSTVYRTRHDFVPASLDCSGEAVISQGLWSFDSASYFALDATGCSIVTTSAATTIVVLGTASNDDTSDGGFALSLKRAESLAQLAKSQYPAAHIVLVALGRERGSHPSGLSRDISMYGRLAMVFTSDVDITAPLKQEPITQTVTSLLTTYRLLDRYETCSLLVYRRDPVATSLEYPRDSEKCRWANRS